MSALARTTPCSRSSTVMWSSVPKPRAASSYRYNRCRRQRPSRRWTKSGPPASVDPAEPKRVSKRGDGMPAPLFAFRTRTQRQPKPKDTRPRQEPAMTLIERLPSAPVLPAPVLATARLRLRAPQREDAPTIAALANDRRIAENTARIPHPYTLVDAEGFLRYL